jgi:16S rRNA pseudouridine516 synthase
MRLDKMIANLGVASRREVAAACRRGGVSVNGVPVLDASAHIDPERDAVIYLGTPLTYRQYTYVMLNKPRGYVSATEDGHYPVVTELLSPELRKIGVFPCGRLDKDTTGLMILTDDGDTAHRLLSPRHHAKKVYAFTCRDPLDADAEAAFGRGLRIDGYTCLPAVLSVNPDRTSGEITLTEGKYHQIKRMLECYHDNKITSLSRLSFGGVPLDPTLPVGAWRYLTEAEIEILTQPDTKGE